MGVPQYLPGTTLDTVEDTTSCKLKRRQEEKRKTETVDNHLKYCFKLSGGSAWESNPPNGLLTRYTGFEVRESHQCPIHFR